MANIPNALTLGNLICGLLGIMFVVNADPAMAFWMMVLAGVFDFLDGFAARLLKVSGEMGKQLDSLADMVTFGVLPGFIAYYLMETQGYCPQGVFCTNRYIWIALPVAAAWRLAKFNIETRESSGFWGVPTPISGLTMASLVLAIPTKTPLAAIYMSLWALKVMPLLLAFFMVSEFPMLSLKFKRGDALNLWKYIFLGISVAIVAVFRLDAMPLIYLAYILISFIANFAVKQKTDG